MPVHGPCCAVLISKVQKCWGAVTYIQPGKLLLEVFTGHPAEKEKLSAFSLRHRSGELTFTPRVFKRGLQRALQAVAELADTVQKRSAQCIWTALTAPKAPGKLQGMFSST